MNYKEKVIALLNSQELSKEQKEKLEKIFPELKESEDEKIRKELIEQVVYIVPNNDEVDNEGNVLPIYQQRIDKYIAWLEKLEIKEHYVCDTCDEKASFEQNPAEWSLPYGKNETADKLVALAECLEMDGDCLFNGLSGDDYGKFLRVLAIELTEDKHSWSEALKDRVQPKQGWSDEDYNKIETIACFLDNIDNEGMAEALRNIRDKYYHI